MVPKRVILVVTGSVVGLRSVVTWLNQHGYRGLFSRAADKAAECVESVQELDAVIIDARLAQGTGRELIRLVRCRRPELYIVGISQEVGELALLREAGADRVALTFQLPQELPYWLKERGL